MDIAKMHVSFIDQLNKVVLTILSTSSSNTALSVTQAIRKGLTYLNDITHNYPQNIQGRIIKKPAFRMHFKEVPECTDHGKEFHFERFRCVFAKCFDAIQIDILYVSFSNG